MCVIANCYDFPSSACYINGCPFTGKSDPYCEVSMGSLLHKTKVIPNTLNPKWNSSMQFPIKSVEDDVLCFTVFDQDRFSPNGKEQCDTMAILM